MVWPRGGQTFDDFATLAPGWNSLFTQIHIDDHCSLRQTAAPEVGLRYDSKKEDYRIGNTQKEGGCNEKEGRFPQAEGGRQKEGHFPEEKGQHQEGYGRRKDDGG
jgi:hypothetical protein